jgi:hypothetical protein
MRTLNPSNPKMWLAYAVAPAATPVSFVVLLFAILFVCLAIGREVNPASITMLPKMAMTAGMAASYLVAGVLGMPIAFVLRRRRALNVANIHLAAFGWACVFASLVAAFLFVPDDPERLKNRAICFAYVLCMTGPSIVLSATLFWAIVKEEGEPKANEVIQERE